MMAVSYGMKKALYFLATCWESWGFQVLRRGTRELSCDSTGVMSCHRQPIGQLAH